ncbi:MAG: zinc ribbon domain-containing protein [Kiritimatiellae bacterium]|nr:zinc ribbon domain-containing protein [Kiritimatiellia bacterium]
MIECDNCGASYPSERLFCGKCRHPLGIRCPFCGFVNLKDDVYCGGCSADLTNAQAPGAAPAAGTKAAAPQDPFYHELAQEARGDRTFTAQIAETLDQAEIRELFQKEEPEE